MKIGIYGRATGKNLSEFLNGFIETLKRNNIEIYFYETFYKHLHENYGFKSEVNFFKTYAEINKNIDFLFSIGGDGTLLNTISLIRDSGIPIAGINTGRLGFLSSISQEEYSLAIENIVNSRFNIEERTLIKTETKNQEFGAFNYALNEITIHKHDTASMINIYAYVNDIFLNSYFADGLIIATPTGSTGYSLSCGGPIITPDSENFVITPIAIHNLSVRPIIIPDSYNIHLKVNSSTNKIMIGLDSRTEIIESSSDIYISKQTFKIKLVRMPEKSFFSTIRNKLMWGADIRN